MDEYTRRTQEWLNQRFRSTEGGVYVAHQPIYGFRRGPSEPNVISRYCRTLGIIKLINQCRFSSFLDAGGAEGYYSNIVSHLFKPDRVVSLDLSSVACQRAHEIYNLDTVMADIHNLPFADNSFDLVLCSETLEHVKDYRQAIKELLRVAKKYLIISTPNENLASHLSRSPTHGNEPHGHINSFSLSDLKQALGNDIAIRYLRFRPLIPWLVMAEGPTLPGTVRRHYPGWLLCLYDLFRPLARLTPLFIVKALVSLDQKLSGWYPHKTADLLVFKNLNESTIVSPKYSINRLIDFIVCSNIVPWLYLK